MANTISSETRRIIEKLYNLKDSDSEILTAKQAEIDAFELSKAEDTDKEKELLKNIEAHTASYDEKSSVYDSLIAGTNLKELKNTKQLNTLEKKFLELSEIIKEMNLSDQKRSRAEETLNEITSRIKQAETTLQELELQKDDILKLQETLAGYIDRALRLDKSITVGEIHDLLIKLGFEEGSSEIELAAQLIIFPKTGLIAYDLELNNEDVGGKSISDVFAEAKEDVVVIEENLKEITPVDSYFLGQEEATDVSLKEEIMSLSSYFVETEEIKESEESSVDLENVLKQLELNPLEFTSRDKELMELNLNPELFAININTIKTSGLYAANERIIYDYPSFLWDKDLKSKLEILTGEV